MSENSDNGKSSSDGRKETTDRKSQIAETPKKDPRGGSGGKGGEGSGDDSGGSE